MVPIIVARHDLELADYSDFFLRQMTWKLIMGNMSRYSKQVENYIWVKRTKTHKDTDNFLVTVAMQS
jgi:hypothetical protein